MSAYRTPPMKKSDEAENNELDMARAQGDVYVSTLNHMAKDVADDGGEKRVGDYVIAYAVEKAEGMHHMKSGNLEWREPDEENVHVEVSVRDGADNRFIPNLKVHVTLIDPDGKEMGTHEQPFVWHPWLYHYGRNWKVTQSGTYKMHVRVEAPDFPRHDEKNGKRYAEDVEVDFDSVKIETGQG
ncbi:iron transporter [Phototrophicus methaneseepsis]|uniref:Iron transporter n=1 Tax=Phototrophicus methaneseepsis TaxID=2710758 RepID=A0A7S8E6J4_9CHLR|nr:iron transporter [Phototrophicus methaneseepsis]QPC81277.1 iron transporter [Phototrophicus methaneseepsis]